MSFTALEQALFAEFCERYPIESLRRQLQGATLARRDHTGVGLFVYFHVPADTAPLTPAEVESFPIHGPFIQSPALELGANSLLWADDQRRLDCLELVAFVGEFPAELTEFTFDW